MGRIVAIGGGEFSKGETYILDKYIVELAGKQHPKLLFIPTASQDAPDYIARIQDYFGKLGCDIEALCLISHTYTAEVIKGMILNADIIYVGGGDTIRMIEKWKEFNVDVYLKEAYEQGVILSGISAGSICWFEFGHSDSDSFINDKQWHYVKAQGLGIIPAAHCPHYNEDGRESFDDMISDESIIGIALENKTAFIENDGQYSLLKADKNSDAYILRRLNGILLKDELKEGKINLQLIK